ncbi:TPA: hypothetical protein EYP38_03040, partial [Candidatus Micrarchaeota archaeon]|nr:hypothetical protein [Candidatus Micrarchaeota archaeon]
MVEAVQQPGPGQEAGGATLRLITGRALAQGMAMEAEGKFSERYFKAVALAELNPEDAAKLGVRERVRVTSEYGSVVLEAKPSKEVPPGTIFVPMGPWASVLVEPMTESTG